MSLYSNDCISRSDSAIFDVDVKIKALVVKIQEKGELKAKNLSCNTKEFGALEFRLRDIRQKYIPLKYLEKDWENVFDRDILQVKKAFKFVKNMLSEKPLMNARLESIDVQSSDSIYNFNIALIDKLKTSDENPLYRLVDIQSVYSHKSSKFKNYLILDDEKIHFDKMEVQITVTPLKMKHLIFFKDNKEIKKLKTKDLTTSRL